MDAWGAFCILSADLTVQTDTKFYFATRTNDDEQKFKASEIPYCNYVFSLTNSNQDIWVPFEAYTDNVDETNVSVDDNGVRRVLSIVEVRIALEDGTYFEPSKKTHVPLQF